MARYSSCHIYWLMAKIGEDKTKVDLFYGDFSLLRKWVENSNEKLSAFTHTNGPPKRKMYRKENF
jgi:hypothetical protein